MPKPLELSVVMPAYREAESLKMLLPRLLPTINKFCSSFEVIVADSMEPLDATASVCAEYGVVHLPRFGGNSYGDAVRSGIARAQGQLILLMDADGSHNPADIETLWSHQHDADIVIGSRYVKGGSTENPWVLIAMSRALNYAYKWVFRLPVADVSNSFRLYKREQIQSLNLVSNNFDIVEEILIRLVSGVNHASVVEVPVTFEQRKAGESKRNLPAFIVSYFTSMRKMWRFRAEELRKSSK